MILSEGAGAVLLAREGRERIAWMDPGGNLSQRSEAKKIAGQVLHGLADEDACIVASANGTFVDLAEREAIEHELPGALVYSPNAALGESVGASAIWQVIVAAQSLRTKRLPIMLGWDALQGLSFAESDETLHENAMVLICGHNQH